MGNSTKGTAGSCFLGGIPSDQPLSAPTIISPPTISRAAAIPPMIERTRCPRRAGLVPAAAFCAAAIPIQQSKLSGACAYGPSCNQDFVLRRGRRGNTDDQACGRDDAIIGPKHRGAFVAHSACFALPHWTDAIGFLFRSLSDSEPEISILVTSPLVIVIILIQM